MNMSRLSILAVCLLVSACAQTIVPAPKSGQYYFQEGETFYEEQNYLDAIASWEKVRVGQMLAHKPSASHFPWSIVILVFRIPTSWHISGARTVPVAEDRTTLTSSLHSP